MAERKTTSKTNSKPTAAQKREQAKRARNNILASIILFGVGVLFIVLSFTSGAAVWEFFQGVYFALFGYGGFVIGFLLLYLAVLIAMHKPIKSKILISGAVVLLASGLLFVFSEVEIAKGNFFNMLLEVIELGRDGGPGGLTVALLGWPMVALFGRPVANIIILLLSALFFMLLTSITPYDIMMFFKRIFKSVVNLFGDLEEDYDDDEDNGTEKPTKEEKAITYRSNSNRRQKISEQIKAAESPSTVGSYKRLRLKRNIDISLGNDAIETEVEKENYSPEDGVIESGLIRTASAAADEDILNAPFDTDDKNKTGYERSTEYIISKNKENQPAQNNEGLEKLIERAVENKLKPEAQAPHKAEPKMMSPYGYELPPIDFFEKPKTVSEEGIQEEMRQTAELLVNTLKSFGVQTKMMDICRGPTITRYELQPLAGVKISKITALADDLALNLARAGVRIEAPIPNKAAVGVEVPNKIPSPVGIRTVLESREFKQSGSPLTMALGQDIAGAVKIGDLTSMPHLLIAGSTGSGKSVCINSCIISLLCKSTPDQLRMILIDPKVVELSDYNGIPHLLMPVVTEPRKAAGALGAAVAEMDRRYNLFKDYKVRGIASYNEFAARTPEVEPLPYIAIIIDELADLMMVSGKEVEDYIIRIAQKARAAGMHLIVATQRPSVDVITGLIKTNIPSRIAFAVSSQVDSRTILDGGGAEKLLGRGDMLFMPAGAGKAQRIQGNYVQDSEITAVLDFVKKQQTADYDDELIQTAEKIAAAEPGKGGKGVTVVVEGGESIYDSMFWDAAEVVVEAGMASTSLLQRRLKLGYARAARIIDELEGAGIIGQYEGAKPRAVLMSRHELTERKAML